MKLVCMALLLVPAAGCSLLLDEDSLTAGDAACPENLLNDPTFEVGFAGWLTNGEDMELVAGGPSGSGQAVEVCYDTSETTLDFEEDDELPSVRFPAMGSSYVFSIHFRTSGSDSAAGLVVLQEDGPDDEILTEETAIEVDGSWQQAASSHTVVSPSAEVLELFIEIDDPPDDFCLQVDDACLRRL